MYFMHEYNYDCNSVNNVHILHAMNNDLSTVELLEMSVPHPAICSMLGLPAVKGILHTSMAYQRYMYIHVRMSTSRLQTVAN